MQTGGGPDSSWPSTIEDTQTTMILTELHFCAMYGIHNIDMNMSHISCICTPLAKEPKLLRKRKNSEA